TGPSTEGCANLKKFSQVPDPGPGLVFPAPRTPGPRRGTPMTNVVIASAARTAIGSYGKSLAGVAPTDLGATAAKAAIERAGIAPDQVEHVVFGNVIHTETADAY